MIKMQLILLLIMFAFASENKVESEKSEEKGAENLILVKIEEDEYTKRKTSKFVGVCYSEYYATWRAKRWCKKERKSIYNGSYKNEETAAHASDTLARQLMAKGEQNLRLNFPDDSTEVHAETKTSKFVGVSYCEPKSRWGASRRSKKEKRTVHNGYYKDEETAARASDTLARKFKFNGEVNHKLNFPDDDADVYSKKYTSSVYSGVSYNEKSSRWEVYRWNRDMKKTVHSGSFKDEETAAHASDTLARKIMAKGGQRHTLNFPDDDAEVYPKKTKTSKYVGVYYNGSQERWQVQRWNKNEKKMFCNGTHKDEEKAAQASDALAKKFMANSGQNLKLNFPDDETEMYAEKYQRNKRKRYDYENV